MSLPVKTTVEDVRTVVGYFKTKPAGATVSEAKAVIGTTPVDGRKLKAYVFWDVLSVDGERYKLTDKGRRMSRAPEAEPEVLREVINGVPAYRSAVEWAFHQGFTEIDVDDLAANWHTHHRDALGTDTGGTIKANVVCFFSIASGAGLGRYVIGRNGGQTRLELDRAAVQQLVEQGPSEPPWQDSTKTIDDMTDNVEELVPEAESPDAEMPLPASLPSVEKQPDELRVFISHSKNMDIVDQVKTTLEIANIQAEIAVEEESTAIPVPDKVFGAMRSCNAGIICVTADENEDGTIRPLNENVLIEIGAAFVLYDKKVVLLWDKRLPVPSNLQGLYRCDYEGAELSWTTGMKLMKAIQKFKDAV